MDCTCRLKLHYSYTKKFQGGIIGKIGSSIEWRVGGREERGIHVVRFLTVCYFNSYILFSCFFRENFF